VGRVKFNFFWFAKRWTGLG